MCCTKFSKVSYHTHVPFTLSGSVNLFLFANTRIGSSLQLVQSAEKAIWYHMFTHDAMYLQKLLFTINEHHDCSWMPSTVGALFFLFFCLALFFFFNMPLSPYLSSSHLKLLISLFCYSAFFFAPLAPLFLCYLLLHSCSSYLWGSQLLNFTFGFLAHFR